MSSTAAANRGSPDEAAVTAVFDRLLGRMSKQEFAGHDPYDALLSPLRVRDMRALDALLVQATKRSPINLRRLLGIPRTRNPKTLALAATACAEMSRIAVPYAGNAAAAAESLLQLGDRAQSGAGWGYPFDVSTRWGSYRAGTPNAVATSYAAHALLDCVEHGIIDSECAREAIDDAVRFATALAAEHPSGRLYFAYHPGSTVPIHNANMLVASYVLRAVGADRPEGRLALSAVAFTVANQRGDGSWPYGEAPPLAWTDGFHTAYVLERLADVSTIVDDAALRQAISRGARFFRERLVDPDGAPRATAASRFPIEAHAAGSAITALCRVAAFDAQARDTARIVMAWLFRDGRRGDQFLFRRGRFVANRIQYIRWTDAHVLRALAAYCVYDVD